jgi:hypothetical protein
MLDWLALRFRDHHHGSFKELLREILLSSTWQQSSAINEAAMQFDPENRWLWRMNRRRVDAETLSDSMRMVVGQLNASMGGYTGVPFKSNNFSDTTDLRIPEETLSRRAVYWPVFRRDIPVSMDVLTIFDAPPATGPLGTRPTSVAPSQTLFLLNSPSVLTISAALSTEIREQANFNSDAQRVIHLYRRLYARSATEIEIDRALDFLDSFAASVPGTPEDGRRVSWNRLCHALLVSNEFTHIE